MNSDDEDVANESHDSNVPFNVLMQQACAIKSKQNEVFRRKFDSWPSWIQHSMFASEEVIHIRTNGTFQGIQMTLILSLPSHLF